MKALIFDLDGTLLDTLADIGNAANAALAMRGYPMHPTEKFRMMVGNGFPTLMQRAVPQDILPNLGQSDIEVLVNDARAYYTAHPCVHTKAYPGISETLQALSRAGKLLAVLSNKMDDMTNYLIHHLFPEIPFFKILGSKAGIPYKPDPSALNAMLAEQCLSPDECLYVGDSNVDVATAHNANMRVVGVAWGFRGASELEENGADHIIHEAAELLPLADAV